MSDSAAAPKSSEIMPSEVPSTSSSVPPAVARIPRNNGMAVTQSSVVPSQYVGSATVPNSLSNNYGAAFVELPSATAQGSMFQVPTQRPQVQASQKIASVPALESEEDKRIFKTCQARAGAWKQLEIQATQVMTGTCLGEGAYAEVFKGYVFGTLECAIKKYRSTASKRQLQLARREIRLTGGSCGSLDLWFSHVCSPSCVRCVIFSSACSLILTHQNGLHCFSITGPSLHTTNHSVGQAPTADDHGTLSR